MKEKKVEEYNYKIPGWMYVVIVLVGLLFVYDLGIIWGFMITLIMIFFSKLCAGFAHKIKKNENFAFLIGILFGLFGLTGYYIYYRIKKKAV